MSKVATEAGYFHEALILKEQPADYYRTTANRYRRPGSHGTLVR